VLFDGTEELERVAVRERVDGGVWAVSVEDGSLVRGEGEGWAGVLRERENTVLMRYRGAGESAIGLSAMSRDWVRTVHVVGGFNNWAEPGSVGSVELDRVWRDGGPVFEGWLELPDGSHEYAFVIDRVRRVADPSRARVGERTSRVIVGDEPGDFAPASSGSIVGEAVKHDARFGRYLRGVSDGLGLADVAVRALGGDAESARVIVERGGRVVVDAPLRRRRDASGFDFWVGRVMAGGGAFSYRFVLEDGEGRHETERFEARLGEAGFVDLPDWAKGAVWYQIFAERFRNGNRLNDPRGDDVYLMDWTSDWYGVSAEEEAAWRRRFGMSAEEGFPERQGGELFHVVWDRRYGGDLQGVVEKLDYLVELGVTAIYFNPVFEGESMHKYDATDFRHIDDNFGRPAEAGVVPGDFGAPASDEEDPSTWEWTASDRYFV
jgi:hypothetical protein